MALFHLSVTQTKRSAGQSAIASAAYRAGERLYLQNLHGCLSAEQLLFYKAHGMESDDRYTVYEEDLYLLISGNCESSMPTNG